MPPHVLTYRYITGGGNDNPSPPTELDEDILVSAIVALSNGIVTGTLYQGTLGVPTQCSHPCRVVSEPRAQPLGLEWWLQMAH